MEKEKDNVTYFSVVAGKTFKKVQILLRTCDGGDCRNIADPNAFISETKVSASDNECNGTQHFLASADANASIKEIISSVQPWQLVDDSIAQLLVYIARRDGVSSLDVYYGKLVDALVRLVYSEDEVEAIVCNILAPEVTVEHKDEWLAFQDYRGKCKQKAREYIGLASSLMKEE